MLGDSGGLRVAGPCRACGGEAGLRTGWGDSLEYRPWGFPREKTGAVHGCCLLGFADPPASLDGSSRRSVGFLGPKVALPGRLRPGRQGLGHRVGGMRQEVDREGAEVAWGAAGTIPRRAPGALQ